jgi:hypothetical protein
MRHSRIALVAMIAALSAAAAGCSRSSSSGAEPSTSPSATSSGTSLGALVTGMKPGVVTFKMAIVGDPGNPSVGVIQTFGGPKGDFGLQPE